MLLYEMLAGKSPFDIGGSHDMPEQSTEDYLFQGTGGGEGYGRGDSVREEGGKGGVGWRGDSVRVEVWEWWGGGVMGILCAKTAVKGNAFFMVHVARLTAVSCIHD